MAENKSKKRRRKKRSSRGGNLLTFIVVLGVVIMVVYSLSVTVFFNINTIEIAGSSRYDKEMIVEMSGVKSGDNLVRLDKSAISDKICFSLPYIGTAKVERKLPDTVKITVNECEPDLIFVADGTYLVASGTKCLEKTVNVPNNLITVNAKLKQYAVGSEIIMEDNANETLQKERDAVSSTGIEDITYIDISNQSDITIICLGKIRLRIGTTESLDKKMNNALSILNTERNKYGESVEGTIDLRYLSDDSNRSYFTREDISSQSQTSEPET